MTAFNGNTELKTALLAEVAKHRLADQLIKGTYGNGESPRFKGCAVSCSLHSLNLIQDKEYRLDDHKAYEEAVGVPRLMAILQDRIFERLSNAEAQQWPERFWQAIPVGANLIPVGDRWLAWIFADEKEGIWGLWKNKEHQNAVRKFGKLAGRRALGEEIKAEEWSQVREGLRDAAAAAGRSRSRAAADAVKKLADKLV